MTGILNLLAGAVGVVKDTYFNLVTLLLPGNGTNGAQNNTFLDSSSNNFTITRNGNTTQGTFSPFSQTGWGNYFGATGNYLSIPYSSSFNLTGDFTVECWINPGNLPSSTGVAPQAYERIFSFGTFDAANSFGFEINSNDASTVRKFVAWYNGTSYALSSNNAVSPGNWYHVALVRSGTTITFYLNGVSTGTITGASAAINTSQAFYIASLHAFESDSAAAFNGYISNFRLVKGTAVYTSNFTPSTTPLTAITNTVLLTCQSNRFIDNSSSPATITVNGTPSVQAFSPFAPTAAYDSTTIGGSGYFDGTGDYLSVSSGITNAGTNDLCVEFFAYYTGGTFGDYKFVFDSRTSGGSFLDGVAIAANTSTGAWYVSWAGQEILGTAKAGAYWNHVCLTRQSGVFRLFVDGVLQGTYTPSPAQNYTSTTNRIGWYYGATTSYQWSGYISNFRTTKSAVPTSYQTSSTTVGAVIFTPPSAPLTTTSQGASGTAFLANFTNAGITDATAKNDLETVGNAQISTTQSKFGGSSMYFDGTGDYLLTSSNQAINAIGIGDFTIEAWVNFSALSGSTASVILDFRPSTTAGAYPTIYISTAFKLMYDANSANRITGTTTFSTGTWYHIAIVRYSGSTKMYVNGSNEGSAYTDSTNYLGSTNRPIVGADGYTLGSQAMNGYIDDLRISKYARYTANFTPPSAAFPVQ